MTPLKWILLGGVLTLYLLFGGAVFMAIEQSHEIQVNADFSVLKKDVKDILLKLDHQYYRNETPATVLDAVQAAKEGVINRISESCGGHNLLEAEDEDDGGKPLVWSYYNSIFFAFTAVTTIGYGNLSPTTSASRIFTIFYSLFGIPINGILITQLSSFYHKKLIGVHSQSKDRTHGSGLTFLFDITFYLIPGLLVFVIVPAGIFVVIEGWTFLESIYFAYVTLTTIGFGDFVAGMGDGHSFWLWLYKIILIIWIIFGLGYFVMILSFITKGMTHDRVKDEINRRLSKIKGTRKKLAKDIDYMRRVVNELYMNKIKPVYRDEKGDGDDDDDNLSVISGEKYCVYERSTSLPHIFRKTTSIRSLNVPFDGKDFLNEDSRTSTPPPPHKKKRRHSETDLDRIDRQKTFDAAMKNIVLPDELLATVVQALTENVNQMIDEVEEFDEEEVQIDEITEEAQEMLPPWELGMLTEADDELYSEHGTLQSDDLLKEVVIHSSTSSDKPTHSNSSSILNTPQLIQRKVTQIIRKISRDNTAKKLSRTESEKTKANISFNPVGKKESVQGNPNTAAAPATPASPPPQKSSKISKDNIGAIFRKISKDNPIVRKISGQHTSSDERKISKDHEHEHVCIISKDPPNNIAKRKISSPTPPKNIKSISQGQGGAGGLTRISTVDGNLVTHHHPHHHHHRPVWELDKNMHDRRSPQNYYRGQMLPEDFKSSGYKGGSSSDNTSCPNSRKISKENQFDSSRPLGDKSHELDHATLSDLLRAIDSVHGKLHKSSSREKINKISTTSTDSHQVVPVCSENVVPSSSAPPAPSGIPAANSNVNNSNAVSSSSKLKRRRKLGVFNPGFTYINPSFQIKDELVNDAQEEKVIAITSTDKSLENGKKDSKEEQSKL